jgi:exodeoxyribonuclease V alpha subunit
MSISTSFDADVTVKRRRWGSEESGWAVVDAALDDGSGVVLVGPLIHLEERERAHVVGEWVDDVRYGPQVKVMQAQALSPADEESVLAYLRRVRHVGTRRAATLVSVFGAAEAIDAIDRDPAAAFIAAGMAARGPAVDEAVASWESLRGLRRLHLLLAPHGLGYLVTRVHQEFGDGAARVVEERPYELTRLFGVGFAIADRIAAAGGVSPDDPERARAAVMHLLGEAERGGSTCLPLTAVTEGLRGLLGAAGASVIGRSAELIDELVASRDVVCEGEWVYRRVTAELEAELASLVLELLSSDGSAGRLSQADLPADAGIDGGLTEEQQQAVRAAMRCRLSIVTGGPGTGKTASIKSIAAVAVKQGARVMLVAPTGRAAIRMTEATDLTARTVHSALGWIPGEGPVHDESDPLPCDLLIVDECSMANLELLVTLLRAIGSSTHVVLVGDADQLAPVGAGKPFAELVESGVVPVARLSHIFRQAAGSMIVQGAHAIRSGHPPSFVAADGMRRDLFLITRMDPREAREEIVSLVSRRLPAHYGVDAIADIQVFAPVYRGELGIDALNAALREALNPEGEPVRGGRLRIGDKVMMTGRNLHELGLMNGTLLTVLDEVGAAGPDDADALLLAGDGGGTFRLPVAEADRLSLAYACSVHRGQGLELPVAVIVAHPAAGAFFLRREMLYTALTRARVATVVVGAPEVVARAARTPDTGRRHSRLVPRLLEAV